MKNLFLNKTFDKSIFTGELIASTLILLLISMVTLHFKKTKTKRTILVGAAFVGAIFIGQGIANTLTRGAMVSGILPSAILRSFFYDTYDILPMIFGAQVAGSVIGLLIFKIYRFIFIGFFPKQKENIVSLTNTQFLGKEILGQTIFLLSSLFIAHATFNTGLSVIDISGLTVHLISLVIIISLLLIFDPVDSFMFSPLIPIFILLGKIDIIKNIKKMNKKKSETQILTTIITKTKETNYNIQSNIVFKLFTQTAVMTVLVVSIGFITKAIKWWI